MSWQDVPIFGFQSGNIFKEKAEKRAIARVYMIKVDSEETASREQQLDLTTIINFDGTSKSVIREIVEVVGDVQDWRQMREPQLRFISERSVWQVQDTVTLPHYVVAHAQHLEGHYKKNASVNESDSAANADDALPLSTSPEVEASVWDQEEFEDDFDVQDIPSSDMM